MFLLAQDGEIYLYENWMEAKGSKVFSYVHFPQYPWKSEEYITSPTIYDILNILVDCDLWRCVENSLRESKIMKSKPAWKKRETSSLTFQGIHGADN